MKTNFMIICGNISEGNINVKYASLYETQPENNDVQILVEELATNEELGLVGDTDFNVYILDRSNEDHAKMFDNMQVPLEIQE